MHMSDWIRKLDEFLRLNEREILDHAGRISAKASDEYACKQYDLYCHLRNESAANEVVNLVEGAVGKLGPVRHALAKSKSGK